MVARSPLSLRRSGRRNELASHATSIREVQLPRPTALSDPTKRNRLSSISDSENLRKKKRLDHHEKSLQYKVPLRKRSRIKPLQSLPLQSCTERPPWDRRREVPPTNTEQQPGGTSVQTQVSGSKKLAVAIEKRILRSHNGGSRTKSELSLYFTDYEEMLSLKPAKPDLLTPNIHITLVDDLIQPSDISSGSKYPIWPFPPSNTDPFGARKPLHNAQRIDLTSATVGYASHRPTDDSMPADVFHKAHRRSERHEKQLRNIEKERAQHEKVQLERLLGELRGPDWLRVMGISGVTESEKKLYGPKRLYFAKEVASLIEKFRQWKEEEKRRKMEKEQSLLTEDEDEEEDDAVQEEEIDDEEGVEEEKDESSMDELENEGHERRSSPPPASSTRIAHLSALDCSDVDAAAARQLHQEAISASTTRPTADHQSPREEDPTAPTIAAINDPVYGNHLHHHHHHQHPHAPPSLSTISTPSSLRPHHNPPSSSPAVERDSGSFFAKPHMREAAIAGHRRGRHKMAFGQPVPEPPGGSRLFELPPHVLTSDMIKKRARARRRLRRTTAEEG